MKNIFLLFGFFFSVSSFAQFSIESSFNSVHIGRNQNLLAKYQWDRFSILAGVKYNFNKEGSFPDGEGNIYKNAFWALDFKEHIGIELGSQYKILDRENLDLFVFQQTQVTNSHIRNEYFLAIYPYITTVPNPQSEYDFAYTLTQNFPGPFWAIENNFGVGLNAYFTNSLYFSVKLGGGIVFYRDTDSGFYNSWELSEMLSMGLGWKLKNKSS